MSHPADRYDVPLIAGSARRHGITDGQILHAYRNAIRMHRLWDLDMLVGPDHSGRLLEVGVLNDDEGLDVIVHAMPVRGRFLG